MGMTDAISRSGLQGQVIRKKSGIADKRYIEGFNDAILRMKSMIHAAPALDVAPVVHARWIRDDLGSTRCSNCHTRLPFRHCYDDEDGYEWDDEIDETPWCMHCGARMDGEVDV